jgi:phosphoserine phosphatase
MKIYDNTIKLVVFDMDGTLLSKKSIFFFSQKYGYYPNIKEILKRDILPYKKNIQIAQYLQGKTKKDLLHLFRSIPLSAHVPEIIQKLKHNNIATAVVTASYQFLADDIQHQLGLDYATANNLIFNDDIVTGELQIHNRNLENCGDGLIYSICKGRILETLCNKLNIQSNQTIAVGDGYIDISMLTKAGIGIAYRAPSHVQRIATYATDDLRTILNHV